LLSGLLQMFNWVAPARALRIPREVREMFHLSEPTSDDLALPDDLPGADRVARLHVRVPGGQVRRVRDDHDPGGVGAVGVVPADVHDAPVAGRPDRRAVRGDDVDAVVEVGAPVPRSVARVAAAAELAADPADERPAEAAVELRGDVPARPLL